MITEFGRGAFDGAAALGPAGHSIVQDGQAGPTLVPGHTRNELEQARYPTGLPDIYREAGAAGAFVFEFAEPCRPRSADPGTTWTCPDTAS